MATGSNTHQFARPPNTHTHSLRQTGAHIYTRTPLWRLCPTALLLRLPPPFRSSLSSSVSEPLQSIAAHDRLVSVLARSLQGPPSSFLFDTSVSIPTQLDTYLRGAPNPFRVRKWSRSTTHGRQLSSPSPLSSQCILREHSPTNERYGSSSGQLGERRRNRFSEYVCSLNKKSQNACLAMRLGTT